MLVADRRIGEILERLLGRRSMILAIARSTNGVGSSAVGAWSEIATSSTALASAASSRAIEACEIGARDRTLGFRRLGGGADERRRTLGEIGLAVEAPGLRIEHVRLIGGIRRARRALGDGRQGEPGRPREHDPAGGQLGADVVGERLHHHAVGRGERANSTKSWFLTKPRDGPSAVTTISLSPASGSSIRCSPRGSSNAMVMLERAGPMMLRLIASGRVGSTTSPPIIIVQAGRRWWR